MIHEEIKNLLSMRKRDFISQVVVFGVYMTVALVCWRCVTLASNTEATIVVVLSGSMEPGYARGDILFLHHRREFPVQVGDIVVFSLEQRSVPIVHRVHRIHTRVEDGKRLLLTKGDNNNFDDRGLYPLGREWIEEKDILGKTFAYVPLMGYFTIWFSEVAALKYIFFGVLGFFILTTYDE